MRCPRVPRSISPPGVSWSPVPNAGYYRVHIALDPAFTNIRHVYTTTQPALRPTEALPDNTAGQSYYWFVQPCRSASVSLVMSARSSG